MMSENARNVVVIAGPSGSGKNAVIGRLLARIPHSSALVTATTRAKRSGEEDGVDYHFLPEERFMQELDSGNIPEHRFVPELGTHYGLYKPDLDARLAKGDTVFAHVDIVGARYLKQHYRAVIVFLLPESLDSLRGRIRASRPDVSEDELEKRMQVAKREMDEHAPEYDYRVVNADGKLDEAVADVIEILKKEGYAIE